MPRVQVVFRRMVSDGNYGHEVAEATLEQDLLPGQEGDGEITATLLLGLAGKVVYAELGRSHNGSIRRTLDYEQRSEVARRGVEWGRATRPWKSTTSCTRTRTTRSDGQVLVRNAQPVLLVS